MCHGTKNSLQGEDRTGDLPLRSFEVNYYTHGAISALISMLFATIDFPTVREGEAIVSRPQRPQHQYHYTPLWVFCVCHACCALVTWCKQFFVHGTRKAEDEHRSVTTFSFWFIFMLFLTQFALEYYRVMPTRVGTAVGKICFCLVLSCVALSYLVLHPRSAGIVSRARCG